ncbi:MAG: SRPBCC family protein [Bacteroidota bacterium]
MDVKEKIVINFPLPKVFKYLSNFNSHKKFTELYKDSKQITKGNMQKGTELFTKVIFLGKKIESNNEVVSFVPDKEITFESKDGPVPVKVKYELVQKGEKTEVTTSFSIQPGGFFNLEEMFLRPRFASAISNSLQNLKKILEAKAA